MGDGIISALSGNSSVKSLSMGLIYDKATNDSSDYHIRSLAQALPGNQGIKILHVVLSRRDETACLLLRSLWAHPRIQSVSLSFVPSLSTESNTSMMNSILRLAQRNTVVHTIDLPDHANDKKIYENFIAPRLEMNRNCSALKRADHSIRGQLLGQALHDNADLLLDRTRMVRSLLPGRSEMRDLDAAPCLCGF